MTDLVFDSVSNKYCRTSSPLRQQLEKKLLDLYGVNDGKCAIFTSGMNAIASIFHVLHRKHPEGLFVLGNELYCDTPKTAAYYHDPTTIHHVDVANNDALLKLFESKGDMIKLFFIETCTNPSGVLFDFTLTSYLRQFAPECIFVADNTWVTGLSFNPLMWGFDLVTESMTKYISAGECIGGFVLGRSRDVMTPILEWITRNGIFVSQCDIFLQGLITLEDRVRHVSATAIQVAHHLDGMGYRVLHPCLPSHPSNHLSSRLKYVPGCLWIHIPTLLKFKKCRTILNQNGVFPFKTSYGGKETRIDCFPEYGDSNFYGAQEEVAKNGIWIRLSIGYESMYKEIVVGLERVLEDFRLLK